jgi:hypothetical protein
MTTFRRNKLPVFYMSLFTFNTTHINQSVCILATDSQSIVTFCFPRGSVTYPSWRRILSPSRFLLCLPEHVPHREHSSTKTIHWDRTSKHVGLRVGYLSHCLISTKNSSVSTTFLVKNRQYKISGKPLQRTPPCSVRTDRSRDIHNDEALSSFLSCYDSA